MRVTFYKGELFMMADSDADRKVLQKIYDHTDVAGCGFLLNPYRIDHVSLNIKGKDVNYESFVGSRIKDGDEIIASLTKEKANLWHLGTGVAGEAGELIDAIKKYVIYGKAMDRENVIEELGDLEFYMQGIRSAIGVTRAEVLEANVAKLEKRYAAKYTDQAAIERADKQ